MTTVSIIAAASFAAIAALTAASSPGLAEAGGKAAANSDEFITGLFAGPVRGQKTYACFVRQYDAAHLAQHRLQKVSAMKLLVSAEKVPEDATLNYSFRLGVNFRHRPGNFDSSGDCGHAKSDQEGGNRATLHCGVDCDGGGIDVELVEANKAVMVRLERLLIWRGERDGDTSEGLVAGADDGAFRLDRASLRDCMPLAADRKELAALRRK